MAGGTAKIVIIDSGMSEEMKKIARCAEEKNSVSIIKDIDELKKLL